MRNLSDQLLFVSREAQIMPKFYFNYFDGRQTIADPDGQDLENKEMALKQAELHAADRAHELTAKGEGVCDESIEVVSEAGDMVVVVPVSIMTNDVEC